MFFFIEKLGLKDGIKAFWYTKGICTQISLNLICKLERYCMKSLYIKYTKGESVVANHCN